MTRLKLSGLVALTIALIVLITTINVPGRTVKEKSDSKDEHNQCDGQRYKTIQF